jgi:glycyl-tRNA synthetase beta chain
MSVMHPTRNLLVELLVEELPPKALKKLGESFAQTLAQSLKTQGLATEHSAVTPFASPRRLGVQVSAVLPGAPDKSVSHKLMPASVGLTADGQPTPALLKKLAGLGADASALPRLECRMDGKSETLFLQGMVAGATLTQGLQKALDEAIAALPIPKLMSYQPETGALPGWSSVQFVRPAHGLVALHGAEVVPVTVLGLESGRETQGHRFEASMEPVVLQHADHYAQQLLEQGAVIAGFASRHGEIARQLQAAASKEGLVPIDDAALLDEVTALVERPNVLLCRFDPEFLAVPPECLILTMKANQKYFPLLDAHGRLTEKFLVVSNIRPEDPSAVIEGNERVVRPRLADAKFFFDQDRRKTLASRVDALARVVYHGKLGTQLDRTERVRAIARHIATTLLESGFLTAQHHARVDQAAQLAKTDLLTDMVGEFPELQGLMGRYYAQHDGLHDDIAFAIEDHYKPRFAGDDLPRNEVGLVLALADKLETLVGLFGIGQVPTGDKDPFALRRHALGVIRMLIEKSLPLELGALVKAALPAFGGTVADPSLALADFVYDRLAGGLREQGYSAQEVDAVLALRPQRLADVPQRLAAVRSFATLPEGPALAAANKRVGNILKKVEGVVEPTIDPALLKEPAEAALAGALADVKPQADAAFERGDHTASLQWLAGLKTPVDIFFDQVMVNTDDDKLRANRLGLLATLHAAMNRVADLSKLAA